MTLEEYMKAVKALCVEIHEEDMDDWELKRLNEKIKLAANMGARDIARSVFSLPVAQEMNGPMEWIPPADCIALKYYEGGRAERFIATDGREHLTLLDDAPYRITYLRSPKRLENGTDVFEFPEDVMNALIYYGAYHVASDDNDRRSFVYFKNLYDQECVNIIGNRKSRMTVVSGKRGGMRVL